MSYSSGYDESGSNGLLAAPKLDIDLPGMDGYVIDQYNKFAESIKIGS